MFYVVLAVMTWSAEKPVRRQRLGRVGPMYRLGPDDGSTLPTSIVLKSFLIISIKREMCRGYVYSSNLRLLRHTLPQF